MAEVVPLHDQPRGGDVDLVEHEGHQHHDHQQAATSHQAVSDTRGDNVRSKYPDTAVSYLDMQHYRAAQM